MYEFDCPQPIGLSVKLPAGTLTVIAEARDTATVDVQPESGGEASREAADRTVVQLKDDTLVVEAPEAGWRQWRSGRLRVEVRVPEGTRLRVKVASADARCHGRFGDGSQVSSASGDVIVDHVAGELSASTASGDLRVGRVDGRLAAETASGDFAAGYLGGEASVATASGDVVLGQVESSVRASTASGDVRVETVRRGEAHVATASGDVSIGVAAGTGVWLDVATLSGTTRNDLDMGADGPGTGTAALKLQVRTASGDITLRRVTVPANA